MHVVQSSFRLASIPDDANGTNGAECIAMHPYLAHPTDRSLVMVAAVVVGQEQAEYLPTVE
jgi:hypothetical protein